MREFLELLFYVVVILALLYGIYQLMLWAASAGGL